MFKKRNCISLEALISTVLPCYYFCFVVIYFLLMLTQENINSMWGNRGATNSYIKSY